MIKLFLNLLLIAISIQAFADPYQWLEEDSKQTQTWVEKQREISEAYFANLDSDEIEKELRGITNMETWGLPERHGDTLYFFRRKQGENKAVLVRMQGDKTDVLVDPNQSKQEVILFDFSLSPDGRYLAYGFAIGGSDQLEWHILDLQTSEVLPECFTDIKFSKICWDKSNDTVYYVKNGFEVYAHRLGNDVLHDSLLYRSSEALLLFSPKMVCNGRYLLLQERPQVVKKVGIRLIDLMENRSFELIAPGNFDLTPAGSLEDEILFITDENCCMGKLIAINAQNESRTLIEESKDLLQEVEVVGDKIVSCYYTDASAVLKIFDKQGRYLYTIPLPGKGSVEIDSSDSTLFYSYTDFYTPVQIYSHDVNTATTETLHTPLVTYSEIVTDQVWYTSKDGTRVPMFLTHRKDIPINENTPVLLYGYGGFAIPVTPFFRSYQLQWVKSGGLLAVPNIRGGKEYGTKWYDDGKLHNKQNVFDDFIAAAEWLIENKVGKKERLGILGSSNGGLLVGAVLTQRPDLFGAAVLNKGVLDMLRFHLFTIGRFFVCDYGNPEDPKDYAYLLSYSPYHNVVRGEHYPPTLINTADHDIRVVPMHSFKFYAALKEANGSEHPILLRLEESCGHGGSDTQEQEISFGRDLLSFFYSELDFMNEATFSATCFSSE